MCPKCGKPMGVLLFMGEIPEFYTCQECKAAFNMEDLKLVAWFL